MTLDGLKPNDMTRPVPNLGGARLARRGQQAIKQFTCLLAGVLFMGAVGVQAQTLTARGNGDLEPFAYVENGDPKGLVVDLARAVFANQQLDVHLVLGNWAEQQQRVRAGDGQILLHINPTPERLQWLDFSDAFVTSEIAIFHRDNQRIGKLADLQGLRVGVEARSYPLQVLQAQGGVSLHTVHDKLQEFRRLSRGELDAIVIDRWVGSFTLAQTNISNIHAADAGLAQSFSRIAVAKGQEDLLQKINTGLDQIKRNGRYNQILNQWSSERVLYRTEAEVALDARLRYAAGLIAVLLLVIGFYAYKSRRTAQQLQMHQQTLQQRVDQATHDLHQNLDRQRELFAVISHELRTPAASIHMLLQQRHEHDDASVDATLIQESEHLMAILDDLRQVVQPDRALAQSPERSSNLQSLLSYTVEALQPLFRNHRLELALNSCPSADASYLFKSQAVRQVLRNLLRNAALHSHGRRVWIDVRELSPAPDPVFEIRVCDDGRGIARPDRLFDPYKRGHGSGEGTGLGLYISKQLAVQLGSGLRYLPGAGAGSCFCFDLRAQSCPEDATPQASSAELAAATAVNLKGKRALVVEDSPTLQMLTRHLLEKAGISVELACDGQEALDMLQNGQAAKFDLILTDLMMPRVDGFELVRQLRAMGLGQPIVGISAATIGDEFQRVVQAGADACIAKPVSLDSLHQALSALERQALARQG